MGKISTFFTWFWTLYFPLCIAFYEYVWGYVDEVMTLFLLLFTLTQVNKRYANRSHVEEMKFCVAFFVFYLIYSLIRRVNVVQASLVDFQQQLRPYITFYCTLILAPKLKFKNKQYLVYSVVACLVLYIYVRRSELGQNENVIFGSLAMSSAMVYYMFSKQKKVHKYVATTIVLVGLLSGKAKYFGECVAFIAVIFFMKDKLVIGSKKSYIYMMLLVIMVIAFAWTKFDSYFVSGMSNEELARPMMYKTAPKVIKDYFPFGPGLATYGTFSSAKTYYSPLYYKYHLNQIWGMAANTHGAFNADSFYPCLAQFGIFGIFFFVVFWKRRLLEFNDIKDLRYYKVALISFFCLAIESFGDTSYLSGRGMVYFMLIAVALNSNRYLTKKNENRNTFEEFRGTEIAPR